MALRDPKARQARALKMLEMKIIHGKTHKEIAKDFNLQESTVQKAMTLARKGDIVVSFEDKLMNELLPLAHSALASALTEGNAKVALEIFKGAGIIRPHTGASASQVSSDHDLSAYIVKKRQLALLDENTIDAQFTRHNQLSLPAGLTPDSESPSEEIDDGLDGSDETEAAGPTSGGPSRLSATETPAGTAD